MLYNITQPDGSSLLAFESDNIDDAVQEAFEVIAIDAEHTITITDGSACIDYPDGGFHIRETYIVSPANMNVSEHEEAAGALCSAGVTGCCVVCGVALTVCDACHGIGYHRAMCPESDETICFVAVREELASILRRAKRYDHADALSRCEAELLDAIRAQGVACRDALSATETRALLETMRPTLERITRQIDEHGP